MRFGSSWKLSFFNLVIALKALNMHLNQFVFNQSLKKFNSKDPSEIFFTFCIENAFNLLNAHLLDVFKIEII